MRRKYFKVEFTTGEIEQVRAFNKHEARILAQAEQIKKGNEYKYISKVCEVD